MRPATSQRSGMCFSWATLRRWQRRSSDKVIRTCEDVSEEILPVRPEQRRRQTLILLRRNPQEKSREAAQFSLPVLR